MTHLCTFHAAVCSFRLYSVRLFFLDNWPRGQPALIPQRDKRNSCHPWRAALGPNPDVCPPVRGNESETEISPPGNEQSLSYIDSVSAPCGPEFPSGVFISVFPPLLELSIQCDVNQYDPHRSTSTQRRSLVQVSGFFSHCMISGV